MITIGKQFAITLLTAWFAGAVAQAQNLASPAPGGQFAKPAEDVQIIIQSQQVRIATRSNFAQMQLQVTDQTGEMTFDSGWLAASEITWPLQMASGAPVKSGLYAYTLSIRDAGIAEPRVRRGHFIVDRAADRVNGGDRLWVTSHNADLGAEGTELTVARDQNAVIAGTSIISERGVEGQRAPRSSPANANELAVPDGTAGHIAKFTSPTVLGNSVMTEVNGAIGVGMPAPLYKLDIGGSLRSLRNTSADIVAQTTGTTNSWARMWMTTTSQRWAMGTSQGFNGNQLYFLDDTFGQIRMAIQPNGGAITFPTGNVGIGLTGNPNARLQVNAPSSAGIVSSSAGNAVVGYSSTQGYAAVFGQNTAGAGYGVYGKGTTGYAVYAEGNAGQSLDKGGFVKAMVLVNADGTISRCYNGQTGSTVVPCGFSVYRAGTLYFVTFGFRVIDRFVSLTSIVNDIQVADENITGRVLGDKVEPNQMGARFFRTNEQFGEDVISDFCMIIY
jgi:hypothetical protein